MAFTGILGVADARLGSIILGAAGAAGGGPGGGGSIFDVEVSSVLSLVQAHATGGSEHNVSPATALSIIQRVGRAYDVSVETVIALVHEATEGVFHDQSISSVIALVQQAQRALEGEAESEIALEQYMILPNVEEMEIEQTVSAEIIKMLATELELEQTVVVNVDYSRSIAHALSISQAVVGYILKDNTTCTYSPFGDLPAAPSLTTGTLTLTWPYASPTTTLELRNPDFGNQNTLTFNRINRTSRGGTLIVFSDPTWPKFETLRMRVQGLTQAQAGAVLDFFYDSLAQEIGLLDWEGRQWRGFITTPEAQIEQPIKGCGYAIEFEFEGELA